MKVVTKTSTRKRAMAAIHFIAHSCCYSSGIYGGRWDNRHGITRRMRFDDELCPGADVNGNILSKQVPVAIKTRLFGQMIAKKLEVQPVGKAKPKVPSRR